MENMCQYLYELLYFCAWFYALVCIFVCNFLHISSLFSILTTFACLTMLTHYNQLHVCVLVCISVCFSERLHLCFADYGKTDLRCFNCNYINDQIKNQQASRYILFLNE